MLTLFNLHYQVKYYEIIVTLFGDAIPRILVNSIAFLQVVLEECHSESAQTILNLQKRISKD